MAETEPQEQISRDALAFLQTARLQLAQSQAVYDFVCGQVWARYGLRPDLDQINTDTGDIVRGNTTPCAQREG